MLAGVRGVPPFALEQAYREQFARRMFDLSSSSPYPLTAREVLRDAGVGSEPLLDGALDSEPAGGGADGWVVLFNNPHGPSGSLVRGSYVGAARLIADEVYRPVALIADHRAVSVIDDVDGAVSVGDLSKPLGLGGLRIGWIVSR